MANEEKGKTNILTKLKDKVKRGATIIDDHFVVINTIILISLVASAMIRSYFSMSDHCKYWEQAALVAIFLFNLFLVYTGLSERTSWTIAIKNNCSFGVGIILGIAFFLVGCAFFFMDNSFLHLLFVFLMSVAFFIVDYLVKAGAEKSKVSPSMTPAEKERLHNIQDEFEKTFLFSDWPNAIGFFILLVTVGIRYYDYPRTTLAIYNKFIGGAIAFQLIASIVTFLIIRYGYNRQQLYIGMAASPDPQTSGRRDS